MDGTVIARRRFVVAAITFYGATTILPLCKAWAQSGDAQTRATRRTLVQLARRLYPHAAIADDVYAQVMDDALSSAAFESPAATEAELALDAGRPGSFLELDESAQIEAIRAVEAEPFFAAIQVAVRDRLYNQRAVWNLIGYEGPSFARGGYLGRGAGDIDWLPESE